MAKIPLTGLPKLNNNPYIEEDKKEVLVENNTDSTMSVKEAELTIPKIEVPKKIKMTNFSYYGKQENINKIKKLAKHYQVSPSTLIDSILEAYFNSENANSK